MRSGNMPRSLHQNWQFAIEVNGFDVARSTRDRSQTEFGQPRPAGSMFDQKVAGPGQVRGHHPRERDLQDGSTRRPANGSEETGGRERRHRRPSGRLHARHRRCPLRPHRQRDPPSDPARGLGLRRSNTTSSRGGTPRTPSRSSLSASKYWTKPEDRPCTSFASCQAALNSSSGK